MCNITNEQTDIEELIKKVEESQKARKPKCHCQELDGDTTKPLSKCHGC